jgi:hypothetical protein
MEVSGQLHAPAALVPGKEPPVPLDRRQGGPQSRSGRCAEQKHVPRLPEFNYFVVIVVGYCHRLPVFETDVGREEGFYGKIISTYHLKL